ncbi:hypothetical protein [Stenotrophomonas tuberculopleuritidis]|uniref:hypothetical protein n=1 Tax=Stenotrophomonas tuberculopleuritidis TaxID=3055079 RepID=UPI0026E51855|nr:hypothetical protein [Stenotrophomonas sp. 704A1]
MHYRLTVQRHGIHWGHFDCDGPNALQHLEAIAARLPAEEGFLVQRQKGIGEQRILSSGSDGLRVLAAQIQYGAL